MQDQYDVAVVGAGIVGLAHAWLAARDGRRVIVFERDQRAVGASIRNFGMIWPIGQPPGRMHEMALASRTLWCELAEAAGFALHACGSLHLAHRDDEWNVLQEFADRAHSLGYEASLLLPDKVLSKSNAVNPQGLRGGLWSPTEMCVDPREVLRLVPAFLQQQYGVRICFGTPVRNVSTSAVETSGGQTVRAERIIVASGSDFETLFPATFENSGLRRCKLQMMRTRPQPDRWRIGPHLASGLTLRHYANFASCPSLEQLKQRIAEETPELDRFGIHVMAAQNSGGEVVLGDSHEYDVVRRARRPIVQGRQAGKPIVQGRRAGRPVVLGGDVTPFDKAEIDDLVLRELRKLIHLQDWTIAERWHGTYAKHESSPYFEATPEAGVTVVTGLGGAGMTLALGLAEHIWNA